ncbi:MAG TPA: HD domain-containing phosphohydrolase [Beijerinckiaceae bacterium]|nr:HD domain-containing phosphohydrolase [Beijerinckiaceae bacterium]
MQGFPASLYSKPTDRRRPAERPVVLVTDRPNPKSAISDALQVIAAVEVVGPDETWDRPGAIAGVVCDLTLARPQAAHCLRRLQARYAGVEPPLLCLLRQVTSGAVLEAKALGAAACLSVDAPPRNIVQALFKIIYPTESIADRLIQASAERTGEILGALFRAAHEGLAPTMALVEPALDSVLDAMAAGGLSRWLDTVRAYDDGTYQHCLLVAGFAANFAQHLRFSRFDQRRVMRAALVHDVGKAKIPRAILNKPGQLDEAELEVMRTHAALGFQLLKDGGECDQATLDAVRHHHEMLDGSGYPDGLRGSEISDLVRLLTICDIYAALTERRPYKPPLPTDSKLRILAEMRDKLDPDLVPAFADSVRGSELASAA